MGIHINQKSSWPALDAALAAIAEGAQVPPSTFAAVADRLRTAFEAPDSTRVEAAAELLENFYRCVVSAASPSVQAASRGEDSSDLATAYTLGKLAFAHLFAARAANTRADERFVDHVRDKRYLPYVQAMVGQSLSVSALHEKVGERLETVSRKLAVLRSLGIVASRKHGNVVVNMLTPAAVGTLETLGLAPTQGTRQEVKAVGARRVIDQARETLRSHMQQAPRFVQRTSTQPRRAA